MFNDEMKNELTKEIVIERYKFIQDKQKYLDTVLHANISFVVKLLVALFSLLIAGISLFNKSPEIISQEQIVLVFQFSTILCGFVCMLFLLMTFSNIVAWFGYRNDEVKLLESFDSEFKRDKPQKRSFLSWQETWFIIALLVLIIASFTSWVKHAEIIAYLLH